MMYMHYCKNCDHFHMLNGHKHSCPGCGGALFELSISFLDFTQMDADERERYQKRCREQAERQEASPSCKKQAYRPECTASPPLFLP